MIGSSVYICDPNWLISQMCFYLAFDANSYHIQQE